MQDFNQKIGDTEIFVFPQRSSLKANQNNLSKKVTLLVTSCAGRNGFTADINNQTMIELATLLIL